MDGIRQIIQSLEAKFSFVANITAMDGLTQLEQAINQIPLYNDISGTGFETSNKTIYCNSFTGSDITGDGSALLPYLTVVKAAYSIKTNINPQITITIDLTGNFNELQSEFNKAIRRLRFFPGSGLTIQGQEQILTNAAVITVGAQPYLYNIAGFALGVSDYFVSDGTKFWPIKATGAGTFQSVPGITGATIVLLINEQILWTEVDELVQFSFDYPSAGDQSFLFKFIYFSGLASYKLLSTNCILQFNCCTFVVGTLQIFKSDFNSTLLGCYIKSDYGIILNSPNTQLKDIIIENIGAKANTGLTLNQNYLRFQAGIYIRNFTTAIKCQACEVTFNQAATGLIIDGCTNGIEVRNNSHIQFTNNCPVYISGTTTTMIKEGENIDTGNLIVTIISLTGTITNMISAGLVIFGYKNVGRNITIQLPLYSVYGSTNLAAGVGVVNTKAVTANSRILLTAKTQSVNAGYLNTATRIAGTSFTITSSNALDNRTIEYLIMDA